MYYAAYFFTFICNYCFSSIIYHIFLLLLLSHWWTRFFFYYAVPPTHSLYVSLIWPGVTRKIHFVFVLNTLLRTIKVGAQIGYPCTMLFLAQTIVCISDFSTVFGMHFWFEFRFWSAFLISASFFVCILILRANWGACF